MTDRNNISIVTELYGNRGLCWNSIDGFQSFILIQKQADLVVGDRVICNDLISDECTIQTVLDADNSLKKMDKNFDDVTLEEMEALWQNSKNSPHS